MPNPAITKGAFMPAPSLPTPSSTRTCGPCCPIITGHRMPTAWKRRRPLPTSSRPPRTSIRRLPGTRAPGRLQADDPEQQDASRIGFRLITQFHWRFLRAGGGLGRRHPRGGRDSLPGNGRRLARSYPYNHEGAISNSSGDVFLATTVTPTPTSSTATISFATIIHEIGHAMASSTLRALPNGAISADRSNIEFTVMSYSSFLSGEVSVNANTIAPNGSSCRAT